MTKQVAFIAVVMVINLGCGGSTPKDKGEDEDVNTTTPQDGENKSPWSLERDTEHYLGIVNYEEGKKRGKLKIGQWPSQRKQGETVPACQPGEIAFGDICWDSVEINMDSKSVTVFKDGHDPVTIAIGQPRPELINPIYEAKCDDYSDTNDKCYTQHENLYGFVANQECGKLYNDSIFDSFDFQTSNPWLTDNCFIEKDNKLAEFQVKTMTFYGAIDKPIKYELYSIAHSWDYKGHIIINQNKIELPVAKIEIKRVTDNLLNPIKGVKLEMDDMMTTNRALYTDSPYVDETIVTGVTFTDE